MALAPLPEFSNLKWVNSSAFSNPVQFSFNFNSIEWNFNGNWMKMERKLSRNRTKIEQNWNGIWTEIEWKLRTDNERSIKRAPGLYIIACTGQVPWTEYALSVLNFCSIYIQFPFNFCSIFVQFLFKLHSIELKLKLNRTEKSRWVDPMYKWLVIMSVFCRLLEGSWLSLDIKAQWPIRRLPVWLFRGSYFICLRFHEV